MGDFFRNKGFWNHARHVPSRRQNGVRHSAHQSNSGTAIDKLHSASDQRMPQFSSRGEILDVATRSWIPQTHKFASWQLIAPWAGSVDRIAELVLPPSLLL